MADAILSNDLRLRKPFDATLITSIHRKKELSMKKTQPILDLVTAKERLSIPFSYRWYRFKTSIYRLLTLKGCNQRNMESDNSKEAA